jgi:DNA-binding transcriptional ArsR family regulator
VARPRSPGSTQAGPRRAGVSGRPRRSGVPRRDDTVFKALGDRSRRTILDRLFRRDGQTLGQLCEGASMTRFGVMKHLRVLEQAGLVVTRKRGREKVHYLNPIPIRLVHDRWVSKYRAPFAAALSTLNHNWREPWATRRSTKR